MPLINDIQLIYAAQPSHLFLRPETFRPYFTVGVAFKLSKFNSQLY